MRLLFVKERLSWPRSSGHDVHTYYSMQALAKLGHTVGLVTLDELDPQAIADSGVTHTWRLSNDNNPLINPPPLKLSRMQIKFLSYWGIDKDDIYRFRHIAEKFNPDAVIVAGIYLATFLSSINKSIRICYAADDSAWHHMSQFKIANFSTWRHLKLAIINGLYERSCKPLLDRVWMVSQTDRRVFRCLTGIKSIDVLPNGVDTNYYYPATLTHYIRSCVFWGRLDFGPNIQALDWFCNRVWPLVLKKHPDSQFSIYGFQPTPSVKILAKQYQGIRIVGDLPDIREEISKHAVVVLPFMSGGGIKNKLLEAAALGKAILCTPRTVHQLTVGSAVRIARGPAEWVNELSDLWTDAEKRNELGRAARRWVIKEHTWDAVARAAAEGIETSLAKRNKA